MRPMSIFALALALLLAPAALHAAPVDGSAAVIKALADKDRPKADVDADPVRKPAETLAFAGLRPGMAVGEFYPGGGYFTRLLSDLVGPRGHVYGVENAGWKDAVKADRALLADGKRPNVSIDAPAFGTVAFPQPLDLVWVTQNYHDLKIAEYGRVDTDAFNRAVFAALKPGGVYFILDHEAPAGTDTARITKLHRIEKAQVIREVQAAGFKLAAEGRFLHQDADDHQRSIFDPAIKGRTDQYALRFVKPRG